MGDLLDPLPRSHELPRDPVGYMTAQEQQQALADARFANVHVELSMNGLMLYAGERAA